MFRDAVIEITRGDDCKEESRVVRTFKRTSAAESAIKVSRKLDRGYRSLSVQSRHVFVAARESHNERSRRRHDERTARKAEKAAADKRCSKAVARRKAVGSKGANDDRRRRPASGLSRLRRVRVRQRSCPVVCLFARSDRQGGFKSRTKGATSTAWRSAALRRWRRQRRQDT